MSVLFKVCISLSKGTLSAIKRYQTGSDIFNKDIVWNTCLETVYCVLFIFITQWQPLVVVELKVNWFPLIKRGQGHGQI